MPRSNNYAQQRRVIDYLNIENARIKYRNFSGKAGDYNAAGVRTFSVVIEEQDVERLRSDGWRVKALKSRPEYPDEPIRYHLPVRVNFGNYPPKIVIISDSGKKVIGEEDLHILDWMEFANVDLVIRPYNYDVNGNVGVKAYLKAMYVTRIEDEFEKKYRNIPDTAASSLKDEEPPWD